MVSQINSFYKIYGKVFGLLVIIVLGAFFPQLHTLSFLIRYLLLTMLFFAFLDIEFKPQIFQRSVLWVLFSNIALAFIGYVILAPFNITLALAVFMTAIAPTAIAALVIISFIKGKVEYVVTAVLVTNVSIALVVPFALPFLIGTGVQISVREVLQPVLFVMFVPLVLARMVSLLSLKAKAFITRGKKFSFPIWLANLFIINTNASNFLRSENSSSASTLLTIALISLVICNVNFGVGALIGGRHNWQATSQSLGQKNFLL